MDTTRDSVVRLLAQVTGRDPAEVEDAARLAEDLRLKSANRIELTVLIGDELDVEISMFDALKAKTVADLVSLVDARRSARST
jgi:acyl carrier protein